MKIQCIKNSVYVILGNKFQKQFIVEQLAFLSLWREILLQRRDTASTKSQGTPGTKIFLNLPPGVNLGGRPLNRKNCFLVHFMFIIFKSQGTPWRTWRTYPVTATLLCCKNVLHIVRKLMYPNQVGAYCLQCFSKFILKKFPILSL